MIPYPLESWKLTLPVAADGKLSGKAAEIRHLVGYRSQWFFEMDGQLVFISPDKGATTPSAKYCRTELRNMVEFGPDDTVEDKLKVKVLACAEGQKVVIDQIHDDHTANMKIVWWTKDGAGRVYALIETPEGDVSRPLLDRIPFGEYMVLHKKLDRNALHIKANKVMVDTRINLIDKSGYFKHGAYGQSNAGVGNMFIVAHGKV